MKEMVCIPTCYTEESIEVRALNVTMPEIVPNPREVWMAQQRVRTDWMRTIIVDEDAKMIWLQGTEW